MSLKTVIFDFDGTLLNSEKGIFMCLDKTLKEMGSSLSSIPDKYATIGPPLLYSFRRFFGMNDQDAQKATEKYRLYYKEFGAYEAFLYDGVKTMLKDLHNAGIKICIATAKAKPMAEIIIKHLNIAKYVSVLTAPADESVKYSADKKEIIFKALELSKTDASEAIMVGDTCYDSKGAFENKLKFIGTLYGYGSKETMIITGKEEFVNTVDELKELLFSKVDRSVSDRQTSFKTLAETH